MQGDALGVELNSGLAVDLLDRALPQGCRIETQHRHQRQDQDEDDNSDQCVIKTRELAPSLLERAAVG